MDSSNIEQEAAIALTEAKKIAGLPIPKINTPADFSAANEQLRELDRVKGNINDKRLSITRPHRLIITQADTAFKEPVDKLKAHRETLTEAIKEYRDNFKGSDV